MSEKLSCPGCDTYTSKRLQQLQDGEPCGNCGLSAQATEEILVVRRVQGDMRLKEKLEAALIRAGKAEGERDKLARQVENIRWVLKDLDEKLG